MQPAAPPIDSILVIVYLAALALLCLWGLHRLEFLRRFRSAPAPARAARGAQPCVTVQLPVYNERTVVAALIDACARLDWPRERLEIQVLDDSSDETSAIVDERAAHWRARGLEVRALRRARRTGYKAGALAAGLEAARGEWIAIFDADFTPEPGFLRRLAAAFDDPRVGMVQARWEHDNRGASLLTRAQAVLLDGHFVIEHSARAALGVYFNFNGTAGLWRRQAILDGGGWQGDTLTEDLDLSYRAQLAGWRFAYAGEVGCAAELPAELSDFRGQQRRWARGSVQVARKLLPRLWRSRERLRVKLEASAHLLGNAGYPLVLLLALLLPAAVTWRDPLPAAVHLAVFGISTLSALAFYDASQRALGRGRLARLVDVPLALALGIGLSFSQTRAVLGGLKRESGEFVRTPKRGMATAALRYARTHVAWPWGEALLCAWLAFGLARAAERGYWVCLPFLALFALGFGWVAALTLAERRAGD
jgi:cellulose synthase/poly-beta-1,6-N-acetylglucosamine synthase-like glycosyltransferase